MFQPYIMSATALSDIYMDTSPDHITPCSNMCMRGNNRLSNMKESMAEEL